MYTIAAGRRDEVICRVNKIQTTVLHELQLLLIQIQLSNRTNISTPGREIKNKGGNCLSQIIASTCLFCQNTLLVQKNADFPPLLLSLFEWKCAVLKYWLDVSGEVGLKLIVKRSIWLTKKPNDSFEVVNLCGRICELKKRLCKGQRHQRQVRVDREVKKT